MTLNLILLVFGLVFLVWSADQFVEGSAVAAKHLGMPPLLIGMIVVGFGTSAPELLVSAQSALAGNPGVALGNAFGSNICNIALILGITALIHPVYVQSKVLKKELPLLTGLTLGVMLLLYDGRMTRLEALGLLLAFFGIMGWSALQQLQERKDPLGQEMETRLDPPALTLGRAGLKALTGLAVLIISSRMMVMGAVGIARGLGVSDLLIGLTIVAIGTSLPELASSIAAARKNENEIALGNIIGSNLFNTSAVIGTAGMIRSLPVDSAILNRDLPVMLGLTLSLFVIGYGFGGRPGRVNRIEGLVLLFSYIGYSIWLAIDR